MDATVQGRHDEGVTDPLAFPSASMADTTSLSQHLAQLHDRILQLAPGVDRIGCALYDPGERMLKTFINSTRNGEALARYEYPLDASPSLAELARNRQTRTLSNLPLDLDPASEHSRWVLTMGYKSSLTIPLYYQDRLLAFLFFDSTERDYFTADLQRELMLYAQVITMAIANELVTIRSIQSAVALARNFAELRDLETGAHLERMSRFSRLIAQRVADDRSLPDEFVENVFLYAPLHDIGKIGIPDRVLLRTGALDEADWRIMKTHPILGREMVDGISEELGLATSSANRTMRNIVELHHEMLDGSGYPHGLKGDEIPLESRIVSVADIFDALTAERPYKRAWTVDQAVSELNTLAARGKLDPTCVDALVESMDEVLRIRDSYVELTPTAEG